VADNPFGPKLGRPTGSGDRFTPAVRGEPTEAPNPFGPKLFKGPTATPGQQPLNKVFGELKPAAKLPPSDQFRSDLQDSLIQGGMAAYPAGKVADMGSLLFQSIPVPGAVLAAGDVAHHAPKIVTGENKGERLKALGNTILSGLGVAGGAVGARKAPDIIPAHNPPEWAYNQPSRFGILAGAPHPPASVAGTPHELTGYVTPSSGELVGRGPRFGEPVGTAQQGYALTRHSPVRYAPEAGDDIASLAIRHIEHPNFGFSRQSAPAVYDRLEETAREWRERGTPITPTDMDTLRQQLRGFSDGASGTKNRPAGNRAADMIDPYMVNPPSHRIAAGTPQDFDYLRGDFTQARGDYRGGSVSKEVEEAIDRAGTRRGAQAPGQNVDNTTRANLANFSATDAGQSRLFGANPQERAAIYSASQVGPADRAKLYLGSGGGGVKEAAGVVGGGGAVGAWLGSHFGLDPLTATAAGTGIGAGLFGARRGMVSSANESAVRAAEEAAAVARRNTPEYAARLAASGGPVEDAAAMWRDRMAHLLTVKPIRDEVVEAWEERFVPPDDPLRITVTPPSSR
jgi:hypothetical protein